MKRIVLLPAAIKLQLKFVFGMLLSVVPITLLLSTAPVVRDWPRWVLIAYAVAVVAVGLIWFRRCLSPDGTSFKPKWW